MATIYTWSVVALDCYPQEGRETDVVFTAHWTAEGTDGVFSGSAYGSVGIPVGSKSGFTPYADLTESQVLSWVWDNGVDKDAIETSIAHQIENQVNPPIVTPPLPWAVAPIVDTQASQITSEELS
jgi:hypothetical protein